MADEAGAPKTYTAEEFHRCLAAQLFNKTWELLDKPSRTPEDIDLMIHSAHASRWHWGKAGGPQQWSVGEWQIARVYTNLNCPEPALFHAGRSLALADSHNLPPFYRASAHQGLAHALAISKNFAAAKDHIVQARHLLSQVPDTEDREAVEADLALIPVS